MDLQHYLAILLGKKWVVLTTLVVTVAVTTLVTLLITPTYTASTTLRVATASSVMAGYSDYLYADRLMNTYTKIATSGPVLKELTESLNLKTKPQVKVEPIPNTELIKISVESSDPLIAQKCADKVAEIMIRQGKELYTGSGKSVQEILAEQVKQAEEEFNQARQEYEDFVKEFPKDSARISAMNESIQIKEKTYATLLDQYDQARLREAIRANIISVVEPALLPLKPSKPNKTMNILLGFAVGSAGGLGLAFLLESFSARLYSTRQIEKVSGLNLIGKIPLIRQKSWMNLVKRGKESSNNANFKEAFRQLQVKLSMINPEKMDGNPLRTLLITSPEPGEGKSTITMNLGIIIAQSGKKVIAVDCDLHLPKLHKIINGLTNTVGLSSVLSQQAELDEAVQVTHYSGMHVLTSGPMQRNPAKLLAGPQMKSLINTLTQYYDVVLLDTPALLAVADTAFLTCIADGVILVVRRNYTREDALREARRHLEDIDARMIGLVVNDAELNGSYYYYQR